MKQIKEWKQEYINKLFSNEEKIYKEAEELLIKNKPDKLFKYIRLDNEYVLKNLNNNEILFRDPRYFNDPYDSIFSLAMF